MNIRSIAYNLSKYPAIKKFLKDLYQYVGNFLSNKKSIASSLTKVSAGDEEHLFGYYDKSPWSKDEKYIIFLKVKDANKTTAPKEKAVIILKEIEIGIEHEIATTSAWNVQQGCMLQWLGPEFNSKIIYNDYKDNKFVSIILDIFSLEQTVLDKPIYSVDSKGCNALTLDFSRLHKLRPGYGYSNEEKEVQIDNNLDEYCIWKINLKSNEITGILKYSDLVKFEHKENMINAIHKVNHIMINPSGERFMFLHRWITNGVKNTRLITCSIEGAEIYNLLDEDMVSHCTWKDDDTIFCWAHTHIQGNAYYYIKDKSKKINKLMNKELKSDGHPSFSKDKKYFVTDTYPDFYRKQHIYIFNNETEILTEVCSVYSNIKYINDCRCDLHPRWSPSGTKLCFDGSLEDRRQVYILDVRNLL